MDKTLIIKVKFPSIANYPVGQYIKSWKKNTKIYAEQIKELNKKHKEIYLFCRGSSGAIIASLISAYIDVEEIIFIRKPDDVSHQYSKQIYNPEGFNVIVDDFTVTGKTIMSILENYPNKVFDLCIVTSGTIDSSQIKNLVTGC